MIYLFDTTLRDGTQGEDVSFSLEDKLNISQALDKFGIHYIEAGWPGSNPKDIEFFQKAKKIKFKHSKITAFGSTRRANITCEMDGNLQAILEVPAFLEPKEYQNLVLWNKSYIIFF